MRDTIKLMAGMEIGKLALGGLKEGAAIQAERARAQAAGMTPQQVNNLDLLADSLMPQVLGIAKSHFMEMGRETRAVLLNPDRDLANILPSVARMQQVLNNASDGHGHGQSLQPVVKALESMGLTMDPKKLDTTMENLAKAFQVFGTNALNAETYRASVMSAGSSAQFWSPEFRDKIFPAIVNEMKDRAGTALDQFGKEFGGSLNNSHGAIKELMRLGLVDRGQVDFLKSGEAKSLKAGQHVAGFETAMLNPLEWVEKILRPALEKANVTPGSAQEAALVRAIAPNKSAASFIAKALEQAELWRKDQANIESAAGWAATNPDNAGAALSNVATALTNFGGIVTAPIMADAAHGLNTFARGISEGAAYLDGVAKAHPGLAKIVAGGAALSWQGRLAWGGALGPLLVVGACLGWAIDNNLTQKVAASDPVQIATIKGVVAGTVNLAIGLTLGGHLPALPRAAGALALGFLSYGVSLVLYVLAMRSLGTARTGAYFSLAPFVGAAGGLLVWHDPVTPLFIAAAALMAVGLWLHLTERHEHVHVHQSLSHSHRHVHDEHHHHEHGPDVPGGGPHTHEHTHDPLTHGHAHFPDIHHRHGHDAEAEEPSRS